MAGEGPDVLVLVRGVPKLDREVARTRRKQCASSGSSKIYVYHAFGVALDSPFQLAQLPVPDFDSGVF